MGGGKESNGSDTIRKSSHRLKLEMIEPITVQKMAAKSVTEGTVMADGKECLPGDNNTIYILRMSYEFYRRVGA
jgi:hypothetical protein